MSFALRTIARSASTTGALRGSIAASSASGLRLASTSSSSREEPKSRAASIINSLPGSPIQKTSYITLGTGLTAAAISTELFVVNEEVVVLGSFAILAAFIASSVRGPYSEWAEGQIERIKGILNQSRKAHTDAVQSRITSVGEMKDVVDMTKAMFEISKETAQLEHETFIQRQKTTYAAEVKATLDSWVRFEAQQREAEQADLVKSIQEKVMNDLKDPKMQKDILAQAVADIEGLVKAGKI
ncbi:hypothetical protein P389DRAFT_208425 [Cystobasidium minutum MCA 4210]|uniref:uncharacterized protein n=1 Tax=Cystobasidium minutum MCA 4210 TaxID=1397322 RepID=UPI0034CF0088|eukprot:jgi/Rhomi1/208425/estExt_Genemark1.C_2_t10089